VPDPFFPERMRKSPAEVRRICDAQRAVEDAAAFAIGVLRRARVRGGVLYWKGEVLTSERLRLMIHREMLARDCIGRQTIVAGGDQACDPHCIGSGPLRANEAIVLDIFPRSDRHGYWADMTRTVVRGRATPQLRRQYDAVLAAQKFAIGRLRAGADGRALHLQVRKFFDELGYPTERRNGAWVGFFHGTGHGVGLDIHEPPRIGPAGSRIPEGAVVTVEPGLYYPGVGGVRIEDMVLVTRTGCRNLTHFPKVLEI
jgi:Xaa-Pro aminopeptidase